MCTTSFHARREDFFYLISCVQHEQNSRSVHAAHWKTDVWFFGFWTLNPRLHTAIEFQGPTTPIRVLNDFQVKLFGTIPLVCPLLLTKACFSHEAENQGTSFLFPLPPPPPPPPSSLFYIFPHAWRRTPPSERLGQVNPETAKNCNMFSASSMKR